MTAFISPLSRALGQLDDRVFLGVLLRSLALSAVVFVILHLAAAWIVHAVLAWHGTLGWVADILAQIGASFLAMWLYLPLAAVIGTLFFDRIARAVERRHYRDLPPPIGASLASQVATGLALGLRILLLDIVALLLALIFPGVGLLLGWAVAAYGIGRGLFVAVAMRRMPRPAADMLYRRNRGVILVQGAVMAAAAMVPVLNLLIPVVGTAAMVHVLDRAIGTMPRLCRDP